MRTSNTNNNNNNNVVRRNEKKFACLHRTMYREYTHIYLVSALESYRIHQLYNMLYVLYINIYARIWCCICVLSVYEFAIFSDSQTISFIAIFNNPIHSFIRSFIHTFHTHIHTYIYIYMHDSFIHSSISFNVNAHSINWNSGCQFFGQTASGGKR